MKIITDYFMRKKDVKGKDYDPMLEINMFLITIKGFAITAIYAEDTNETEYENTVNKIIELYK
jgi:hypothetical protein